MSTIYIPDELISKIESLKESGKFDEAMKLVNSVLIKNPDNEDALLQVADIQYRKGDMSKASKAIDFLNFRKNNADPMGLYVKGVLEMEKNNWTDARKYFEQAMSLTQAENHEVLRCYGLCEYWYGNREKGVNLIKDAFGLNDLDAEVICNLIQLYILEKSYQEADDIIRHYYDNHDKIWVIDKTIDYYDSKVSMFKEFLKIRDIF